MSLSIDQSYPVFIDNILPVAKDAVLVTLVWAVFAKVLGLDNTFPAIVFIIALPIALYGMYRARKRIGVHDKQEPFLNNAALSLLKTVNSKTKEGASRKAAHRFFKHLLAQNLKLSISSANKLTLHFYREGYRYSQKDSAWLIIPALVVLNIDNSGVCEFEKGSELYEMKYSKVLFREKFVWKKLYPGAEETFTIDVEKSEGWLKVSGKVKDMRQKRYKELL